MSLTCKVCFAMSKKSATKFYKQTLRTTLQNKLLCLMKMVISAFLENSYPNNCSETPNYLQNLEMVVLENFQRINPTGLSFPLVDSKTNNSSATPKCHQDIEIITLKSLKCMNPIGLSEPFALTLKPTICLKHQTVTKTLR